MISPRLFLLGGALSFLAGCALVQSPVERVHSIAQAARFVWVEIPGSRLRTYLKVVPGHQSEQLTVYIESDGAPWPWPDTPPTDPTPVTPLVMGISATDAAAKVAYVGRPCQFLAPSELANCDPALWTSGRFRLDAIQATALAIDALKVRSGANFINLVGYSGGGAMAALVASRRTDVKCLVTIAAPLDTNAWTDAIGVSRLSASLNPADVAPRLNGLPQTHFRGVADAVVPLRSVGNFKPINTGPIFVDVPGFDHECCWEREWATLRARSCLASS